MKNYPFIICCLTFICGILTNYFFRIGSNFFILPLILTFIITFLSFALITHKISRPISIISFLLFLFILGNFLYAKKIERRFLLSDESKTIEGLVIIGNVQEIELVKNNEVTFEVKSDSIRIDNVYRTLETLFLCKVRDDSQSVIKLYNRFLPGNKVRIEGTYMQGREARNPGEFDYNNYLHSKGISGILYVNDEYEVKIINWNFNSFKTAIFRARKFIDDKIIYFHNIQSASLLRGLLLADRSGIDLETRTEFVNSGVMHILAVSGLHVGYIILIFFVVFGRLNIFLRSVFTIVGLVIFLLLTGMPASVFRAVTMAVVVIIAYLTNRSSNIYNSLAVAAFILLVLNPVDLFNPGFQLSFTAVLSIAVIYPIISKYITSLGFKSKIITYVLLFMGVSFSAQIGTLPLTLIYFGKLSLVALLTNLFIIPLAGIVVGIAIFTLILSVLIPPLASVYAWANQFIIFLMFKIISISGGSEYSFIYIRDFTVYNACIFYLAALAIILGIHKITKSKSKLIFAVLVIINAILLNSLDNKELLSDKKLNVMMIDVSQGDATLIKFPNGKTALIDAGYASFYFDNGERTIKPLLNYLSIDTIDYAFVSSMSQECYGGFISLIKSGIIKNFVKPLIDSSSLADLKFQELLQKKSLIKNFSNGILEIENVRIYFLSDGYSGSEGNEIFPNPVVLKLIFGNTSFLLPGNIENEMEYRICYKYKDFLKSDVLKVSNHGSIKSSSVEFLQTVKPKISLISVGYRNKFDYPSQYIIDRLKNVNSQILRTDERGTIILQSDGYSIKEINWK